VYSSRLQLPDVEGDFGTNGKGRSEEYCQASAYAEFIERLQNGLYAKLSRVMLAQLRNEFGFYYAPDETYLTRQDFLELPKSVTTDLIRYQGTAYDRFIDAYFGRLNERHEPGAVAVPFYSTMSRKLVFLPLNLLLMCVGSNGMAAGNTGDEALFQALCELLERWASAEVFYHQLTPPTVPDDFLRKSSRNMISSRPSKERGNIALR
jgi:YcaO-like protein with predicted kinase domain